MWQGEPLGLQLEVAEQEQVEVDRPRAVPGPGEGAAVLDLDPLADVQQRLGLDSGADAGDGIEEVRLIEKLPHRLGLVQRGHGLDIDPVAAQILHGAAEMGLAVAEVRPQPDVADAVTGRGPAQTSSPSSSSPSPASLSSPRSSVTSTTASSTG